MESEGAVILGTVFAISSIVTAFVAFSGGILSDRFGRRLIIVGGTVLFATGTTLLMASQTLPLLLILSVIFIMMSPSFYRAAVNALITESTDDAVLGRAFSIMPVLTLVGMSSGSAILGYITESVGLFYAMSVSFVCAWTAVGVRMLISEPVKKTEIQPPPLSFTQVKAVTLNNYLIFFAFIVIGTGLISWFSIYLPSFMSEIMSIGEKTIGILFSIFSISQAVMQPVAGWFIDKFSERWALAVNLGGSGIFILLFLFFSHLSLYAAIISLVISSSLSAFYNVGYSVYIARATNENIRGTVFGGMETLGFLSSVPAPLMGAFLWEKSPYLAFALVGIGNIGLLSFLVKKVEK
jgi:MFS family permease